MPRLPPKACSRPGCPRYAVSEGRCEAHKRKAWDHPRRGDYGSRWRKTRARILERDAGLCQECARAGRLNAGNTVDHIVPRAEGGTDAESNLEVLCRDCHKVKSAREGNRASYTPTRR
jgi:5-methylcytosine-specific restriction protein A